jgi:hypothetical protein
MPSEIPEVSDNNSNSNGTPLGSSIESTSPVTQTVSESQPQSPSVDTPAVVETQKPLSKLEQLRAELEQSRAELERKDALIGELAGNLRDLSAVAAKAYAYWQDPELEKALNPRSHKRDVTESARKGILKEWVPKINNQIRNEMAAANKNNPLIIQPLVTEQEELTPEINNEVPENNPLADDPWVVNQNRIFNALDQDQAKLDAGQSLADQTVEVQKPVDGSVPPSMQQLRNAFLNQTTPSNSPEDSTQPINRPVTPTPPPLAGYTPTY